MIKGNMPITKHIIDRITNDLACVLTIDFTAILNTMFSLKIFIKLRIYIIKSK